MQVKSLYRSGWLSPVAWTRAIVMDLGFAGLIEKIEERLGKGAGTLMICLLMFLVIVWCVRLVFGILAEISELSASADPADNLMAAGLYLLLAVAVLGIGFLLCNTALNRKLRSWDARFAEWRHEADDLNEYYAKKRDENLKILNEARAIATEWEGRLEDTDRKTRELEAMIATRKSGAIIKGVDND